MRDIKVLYLNGLDPSDVAHMKSFSDTGRTYTQLNADMRNQIATDLTRIFGRDSVDADPPE
jgi:hypothetical protein